MLFCHVIADYNLQGILASMKQKSWWKSQSEYEKKYSKDWIPALIAHCISWTFIIMLPILFYYHFNVNYSFYIVFIVNCILHFYIDNLKANRHKINLIQDQICHLLQIVITFLMLIYF